MKKIIISTIVILLLPFIVIVPLLFFGINLWNKLDFWYAYMAFFGSVVLGAVALIQNHKANIINKKLLLMQEETQQFQMKEKSSPIALNPIIIDKKRNYYVVTDDDYINEFDIVNQKYKYFFFIESTSVSKENGKLYNIVIEIENISNILLKEIYIENFKIYDIITNASGVSLQKEKIREYKYHTSKTENHASFFLRPNEKVKLCLKFKIDDYVMTEESFHISFDISTISIYNVIFSENVDLFRNNVVDEIDRVFTRGNTISFRNASEKIR